ncbi:hypothetical protein [Flagellimonas myxillae]|uniref:hypothetical protein n=1 Tax=Flagellimonas myxillae TaxID=2942214 RepID=UPI00201F2B58|nr:hypothetical protein [Muricauda myxillae]MCL6265220.1 hypothetical protein [Muricauda myxillae]
MRIQTINLLTLSIVFLLIFSCSQEEIGPSTDPQSVNLQLNFESPHEHAKKHVEFDTFSAKIISLTPLVIESEELEVIQVLDGETDNVIHVIIKKGNTVIHQGDDKGIDDPCKESVVRGYWWDGKGCWVYGDIVTLKNCMQFFFMADKETQAYMNVCGWDNVA